LETNHFKDKKMTVKEEMLIFVDSVKNNNKFYHMILNENNSIDVKYGRVGTKGTSIIKYGGEREYNKLKNSKLKKGYEVTEIALENSKSLQNDNILDLAMSQIQYTNIKVKKLIQRLVDKNIHQITNTTKIEFNKDSNLFTTPLGPVTLNGIQKAKNLLFEISKIIDFGDENILNNYKFVDFNERYFKIIPKKIKNLREKEQYMLYIQDRIDEQFSICDTLEKTLNLLKVKQPTNDKTNTKQKDVFKVSINLLEDKKIIKEINTFFEKSKNSNHGYSVNSLKIENIYKVSLGNEEKQFRDDLNNKMLLFHGTRVANILSILKSGLMMPKQSPGSITGSMFGNGLYFSDQSTKSLNYCDGFLWNDSSKQDKVYMLMAEVAMGNYKVPNGSTYNNPPKGYDSYFAQKSKSGVRNNEMIVFNLNQIKIKYLLEIC